VGRRTPILRPVYGVLDVLATVALIAWIGWWSALVVVPLNGAVIYVFFWPGLRSR
jgi:hypothetical protein